MLTNQRPEEQQLQQKMAQYEGKSFVWTGDSRKVRTSAILGLYDIALLLL